MWFWLKGASRSTLKFITDQDWYRPIRQARSKRRRRLERRLPSEHFGGPSTCHALAVHYTLSALHCPSSVGTVGQRGVVSGWYVAFPRAGQRTGYGNLHPVVQPLRAGLALDGEGDLHHLTPVGGSVDGVDAVDDPMDTGRWPGLVVIRVVVPRAQRSLAHVIVVVDVLEALAQTPVFCTPCTVPVTKLFKHSNICCSLVSITWSRPRTLRG